MLFPVTFDVEFDAVVLVTGVVVFRFVVFVELPEPPLVVVFDTVVVFEAVTFLAGGGGISSGTVVFEVVVFAEGASLVGEVVMVP